MRIRYISVEISNDYPESRKYKYEFKSHCRYICNFMSKAIRNYKIEVTDSYNMILIELGSEGGPWVDSFSKCLHVYMPFDKAGYEQIKGSEDHCYYLHILDSGLKQAFSFSNISHLYIESLMNTFKEANGQNEWIHKRKVFKEIGLKVEMVCRFTTNDFKLSIRFIEAKSRTLIREVLAIRSYPDEIAFDFCFRDIVLIENKIWITDFQNRPYLYINTDDIMCPDLGFNYSNEYVKDEQFLNLLVKNTSVDIFST